MSFDIHEAAQGRWRGILSHYGLSQQELSGKHGPCPICAAGKDRFRFDDKHGRGSWICSHCGSGSGIDLIMKLKGYDFRTALSEVKELIGHVTPEAPKPGLSEADKRKFRIELWNASRPVERGDPVDRYLASRGVDQGIYPPSLRFCPSARYSATLSLPAMVAAVQDANGQGVTLHRTFLSEGGKADVERKRMLMPGAIPNGSAVRLGEVTESVGIAEGIETALAAGDAFGVPTWAALNASLLAEWTPPRSVREVTIFGDNDANFTGQAAAYQLARRLSRLDIEVNVKIPDQTGLDWADSAQADAMTYDINRMRAAE